VSNAAAISEKMVSAGGRRTIICCAIGETKFPWTCCTTTSTRIVQIPVSMLMEKPRMIAGIDTTITPR